MYNYTNGNRWELNMIDYAYTLSKVYPDKKWTMNGDSYRDIEWLDNISIPEAQLEEAYLNYKISIEYLENRVKEYPSIEDQLDLIYHGGVDAWKAKIAGIKAKYPKPEGS